MEEEEETEARGRKKDNDMREKRSVFHLPRYNTSFSFILFSCWKIGREREREREQKNIIRHEEKREATTFLRE